ncbi:hypothetical protein ACWF95_41925 [Streptomyces vinaceus]
MALKAPADLRYLMVEMGADAALAVQVGRIPMKTVATALGASEGGRPQARERLPRRSDGVKQHAVRYVSGPRSAVSAPPVLPLASPFHLVWGRFLCGNAKVPSELGR